MSLSVGAHSGKKAALLFLCLPFLTLAAALLVSGCTPKPVATVNGASLTEKEFGRRAEMTSVSEIQGQQGTVGLQVLLRWIAETIMTQEAKRNNVYPSETDLDRMVDAYRKQAEFSGRNFEEVLKAEGMTLKAFRERVLNEMVRNNVLYRGLSVTDAEIQQAYTQQKQQFSQPETVRISQITTESEAAAKKAKNDLNGGAPFEVVASTYSKDMFARQGGKVTGRIPKQIPAGQPIDQKAVDAAFKLKAGQVSEPIKVSEGRWVIVKQDELIPGKTASLDEVREFVRNFLRVQKSQTAPQVQQNQQQLAQAIQSAKIQVNRPEYQGVEKQLQQGAAGAAGGPGGMPGGPGGPGEAPGGPGGPEVPPGPGGPGGPGVPGG